MHVITGIQAFQAKEQHGLFWKEGKSGDEENLRGSQVPDHAWS